jgi:hypothetical protein
MYGLWGWVFVAGVLVALLYGEGSDIGWVEVNPDVARRGGIDLEWLWKRAVAAAVRGCASWRKRFSG